MAKRYQSNKIKYVFLHIFNEEIHILFYLIDISWPLPLDFRRKHTKRDLPRNLTHLGNGLLA